jgi:hypothetical protein
VRDPSKQQPRIEPSVNSRSCRFARLVPSILSLLMFACSSRGRPASDAGSDVDSPVCSSQFEVEHPARTEDVGLRINEAVSANDGAAVDAFGETDDFVELFNASDAPIELADFLLADPGHQVRLPARTLSPGERLVLWADGQPEQGEDHLIFKLERDGEPLSLWRDGCTLVDALILPALDDNEAFARFPDGANTATRCRYASPARENPARCAPHPPAGLSDDVTFSRYDWPDPWPASEGPLVITELALAPDGFVEIGNASDHEVTLDGLTLELAAHAPGVAWPAAHSASVLALSGTLAPSARITHHFAANVVSGVLGATTGEGVITLFANGGRALDRLDFMSVPDGSALVRQLSGPRLYQLCQNPSPDKDVSCAALAQRPIGDRLRALRSDGDFAALSRGGTELGSSAVKFVVDMEAGDVVHLLGSERWALHYTFVREQINKEPPLNRCDSYDSLLFNQGWYAFSEREYFRSAGRRYLLGTLVKYANGLHTVEFAIGDTIVAEQMRRAFFAAVQRMREPTRWALRPQDAQQLAEMQKLDGQLPIVGSNAPFRDLSYQPLTRAIGFGTLRFVPASELASATLGAQVIVITDDVPNDIPLVGGLITEAFQTPLAHVNVLSEARGTPNMALRNARADARLGPLLGKLVRIEVGASDFDVRAASADEAAAFYAERSEQGPRQRPLFDESLRGVQALSAHDLYSAQTIGSKAAQLAELAKVDVVSRGCPASTLPLALPTPAMAVPFAHYSDHLLASGAAQKLSALLADPAFAVDATLRAQGLSELRALIVSEPVEPSFLSALVAALKERFGDAVLRFRSSSNVEDLDTFNGAGLHTSTSASLAANAQAEVENALRVVWASLWNERAYEERELGHLDQSAARMAVLIHERFTGEAAQGVAISRNLFDLTRSDMYYVNTQRGEASVTNPAPGVATEQLLYTWPPRTPELKHQSYSSLYDDQPILSPQEVRGVVCALAAIHQHFAPRLDPSGLNRTFAMQIEWKHEAGSRKLFVKQARPQPFGHVALPHDCRDL